MNNSRTLHVLMNSTPVGVLMKDKKSNALSFKYEDTWLNTKGARPISLSIPLSKKIYEGDLVYNFFDNLLPDNTDIRKRIQTLFAIKSNEPFDILSVIGKDCVGALQLVEGNFSEAKKSIDFEILSDREIANHLRGYQTHPLGMAENHHDFRISIAGAQEKTALLFHKGKWCLPKGTTPTTHIFKLPIGYIEHQGIDLRESCENEWICTQIAQAFGLPVAPCEILTFDTVKALVVERFDRIYSEDGKRILRLPQEDFCQALGISPQLKYQADGGPGVIDIMKILMNSTTPLADRTHFIKSQVLFWLLAATDGHAKNFSIFIRAGGKIQLTPLYDILSTYPLIASKKHRKQKLKMAMALKGKTYHYLLDNWVRRHFIDTAKHSHYSPQLAEQILDEMISQVESVITQVTAKLPKDFPAHISAPIFEGMTKMSREII